MRCVGLYVKAFTQKNAFPLFTLRNVNRCNKSLWIRDRCSYLSSRLFPFPFPPCWNSLLHSSALSTGKLVSDSFFHSDVNEKDFQHRMQLFRLLPIQTMGPLYLDEKRRWLRDECSERSLKVRSCLLCWTLRMLSEYLVQLPFLMSAIKPHEINGNCRLSML